jgi:hypothetical protein
VRRGRVVADARPARRHRGRGKDNFASYRERVLIPIGSVVRDFNPSWMSGGHPDFARAATAGTGRYVRIASDTLDAAGKPVFATSGHKLLADWADAKGRPIISTKPYIAAWPGDTAGSISPDAGGAVVSATAFAQWFRDVPGVNQTRRSELTLAFEPSLGVYAFDGSLDTAFSGKNAPDYTYTYEMEVPFVYEPGRGWYIAASTNADLWIYIDGQLVIDAGSGLGPMSAFAVDGTISMSNSASVSGPDGAPVTISTNSTANGAIQFKNSAKVVGDALAGPGADPSKAISGGPSAVTGSRGALAAPVPMPIVSAPTDLGPSVGDRIYSGGTHTIDQSFRARRVVFEGNTTVNISGDITIYAELMFDVGNNSTINLLPNSTLTIYAGKDFYLHNSGELNINTMDPSRVLLINLGSSPVEMDNRGQFVGPWGRSASGTTSPSRAPSWPPAPTCTTTAHSSASARSATCSTAPRPSPCSGSTWTASPGSTRGARTACTCSSPTAWAPRRTCGWRRTWNCSTSP